MRAVCIMLLIALSLQGCGHKGPLVLPQSQPSVQQSNHQGQ
jgi:predicted small lipoprotein YifL